MSVALENLPYLLRGAGMTVLLSVAAAVPATLAGLCMALARRRTPWLGSLLDGWLFLMRGIPLIVLLVFVYFLLPRTGLDLPPFWGVTLVLAAYYAAFMSEVFRAGFDALPNAQWEAGRSLGLSEPLLLFHVIGPQALRVALPAHLNLCASLIKGTSLASVIGLWELTLASLEVVERTLAPFPIFLSAAGIYFTICFALDRLARRLEVANG